MVWVRRTLKACNCTPLPCAGIPSTRSGYKMPRQSKAFFRSQEPQVNPFPPFPVGLMSSMGEAFSGHQAGHSFCISFWLRFLDEGRNYEQCFGPGVALWQPEEQLQKTVVFMGKLAKYSFQACRRFHSNICLDSYELNIQNPFHNFSCTKIPNRLWQ